MYLSLESLSRCGQLEALRKDFQSINMTNIPLISTLRLLPIALAALSNFHLYKCAEMVSSYVQEQPIKQPTMNRKHAG
jgi:hypothetical protein